MNNKGIFEILKKGEKYSIVYIEKGDTLDLSEFDSKYSFDNYDAAKSYIDTNKDSLDAEVTKIKDNIRKIVEDKIAAEKAEQERKEAEWIAKGKKKEEKKARRAARKQKRKERRQKALRQWKGYVAGFLTAAIVFVGGHFAWVGISSLVDKSNDKDNDGNDIPTEDVSNSLDESNDIPFGPEYEEELTVENFTNLVAEFSKEFTDNNVNVTSEDLMKFVSILNIDKLFEDNYELANQLFGTQSKEEYVGDAAKVIGMVYTYNRNVFEKEGSTENFIRISNGVSGEQKELLKTVEEYVDQIALAKDNADETNRLISELIQKLGDPTSELSYLDDGVGFGMQVSIELIRSDLARNVISQENLGMLTTLTSSEEYVSNIFTTYSGCVDSKTKTRTR